MTTIKELKKDAKVRLSGVYLKLTFMYLIYGLIFYAFSKLESFIDSSIIKLIYSIILLIFTVPFSYGFISCFIKIIRGEKVSTTEFINVALKNISKAWKVYWWIFVKLLIPIILIVVSTVFLFITLANAYVDSATSSYFIISAVVFIFAIIYFCIMNLYYSFSFYILNDNPEKPGKEIVNMSRNLMKGNLIRYIGLYISFIGWYLLILAVGFILQYFLPLAVASLVIEFEFLLLFPYITTAIIGLYEDVLYDKTNAEEKN